MTIRTAVLVGSQSADSINRLLAEALKQAAPEGVFEFVDVDLSQLPMYNRDLDANFPAVATDFKQTIAGVDALLFVSPEHNRTIPALLANAIEWASRPWGESVWAGKKAAIAGISPSPSGTIVMQQHLRTVLSQLDVHTMDQPWGWFTQSAVLTEHGNIQEAAKEKLADFMTAFAAWTQ